MIDSLIPMATRILQNWYETLSNFKLRLNYWLELFSTEIESTRFMCLLKTPLILKISIGEDDSDDSDDSDDEEFPLTPKKIPTISAVENLERSRLAEKGSTERFDCAICWDDRFPVGSEIMIMPCSHAFHANCLLFWLTRAHTCPTCRHELPTRPELDDPYPWPPTIGLEYIRSEIRYRIWGIAVIARGYCLIPYDVQFSN